MSATPTADTTASRRCLADSIDRPGHPIDRTTEAALVGGVGDREELR